MAESRDHQPHPGELLGQRTVERRPPRHAGPGLGFPISGSVTSEALVPGSTVVDMFTDQVVGTVDDLHTFSIDLGPHEGRSLLVLPQR